MTPLQTYRQTGFCIWSQLLNQNSLGDLEATVADLVRIAATKLNPTQAQAFASHNFDPAELPHRGLIRLYQLDPELERYVVDAAGISHAFHQLIHDPNLHQAAAQLADCPVHRLGAVEPFLRVDPPEAVHQLSEKLHLPWHQEGSYYQSKLSNSTGLVAWLPLFDCGPEEGALDILSGSFRMGPIPHQTYCLDPEHNRNHRTRLPESITAEFEKVTLNVKRGNAAFQHFNTIHRGGRNRRKDRVRYTALVRFSDITAPDFRL